jgi:hypothetical protein
MAGASVIAGKDPKSITSYLAKGGPRRHPFRPAFRFLYRLYWLMSHVRAGRDREDELARGPD